MIKITIQRDTDIVSIQRANDSLQELIGAYLSSLFVLGYSESQIESHMIEATHLIKNNQQNNEPTNKNVMPLGL